MSDYQQALTDAWNAIDQMIVRGDIPDAQHHQRNGLVLACNKIAELSEAAAAKSDDSEKSAYDPRACCDQTWLDEQNFYEVCQTYRHARDGTPAAPGLPNAAEAFDALKVFIASQMGVACRAAEYADSGRPYSYDFIKGRDGAGGHFRIRDFADNVVGFCYSEFNAQHLVRALNGGEEIEARKPKEGQR